jgi:hypothetical protein
MTPIHDPGLGRVDYERRGLGEGLSTISQQTEFVHPQRDAFNGGWCNTLQLGFWNPAGPNLTGIAGCSDIVTDRVFSHVPLLKVGDILVPIHGHEPSGVWTF